MEQQEIYQIEWAGSEDPKMIYSVIKGSLEEATKFSEGLSDAIVTRLVKTSENAYQYQVVPTQTGKDLVLAINARRKLKKKALLVNREGVSSLGIRTVPEFQKSQRSRGIGILVVPSVTIYAGTRKELPMWLRASLIAVGVCSLYVNGINYMSNKKLQKSFNDKK